MAAVIVPTSAIVSILDFIELEEPEEPAAADAVVELRVPDENCRRANRELLYCIWGRSQAN